MQLSVRPIVLFAVVATVSGFVATVALPSVGPAAPGPALTREQEAGRAVYVRENCMVCHTQQVRTIESRFGMIAEPGDIGQAADFAAYAGQTPALLGGRRVGPDLLRVGARIEGAQEIIALLRAPSERTPGSRMPSYAHLSDEELRVLAAYLLSLK
ncbi:MAG: cbb3-type cytochrome c oxidase subunit II [Armatimonadota bacterium]|nr:cbb3-type cytochrome c oxidase subunit II [Armatimonadota bacterium]MDR5698116.1 cbb3-type cytochrome c oxidase subunit II [Armatimonadota bacterium]